MYRAVRLLAILLSTAAACAAGKPSVRPGVDPEAMREAMESEGPARYISSRAYFHYIRGMMARYAGDSAQAAEELREALVYDPDSAHVRTVLADEYVRMNEVDRALNECRAALEREPGYAPAHLLAGKIYGAKKQTARAVASLNRAVLNSGGDDREAFQALWGLYLDQGDDAKAVETVERYSAAHPEDPSAYVSLSKTFLNRSPPSTAQGEGLLLKALSRAEFDSGILKDLGELAAARRRNAEAIEYYERALRREPDDREVMAALGMLYLRKQDDASAKAYFDRLTALDPESADLPLWAARSYLSARRYQPALAVLEIAAKREPRNRKVIFYRAWTQEEMGDYQSAARGFSGIHREDFAEDSEEWATAQIHLGYCLSRLGKHDEALALLTRTMAVEPERPDVVATLAGAYERAGRVAQGIDVLEAALKRGPSPDLAEALARLYQGSGRHKEAVALIENVLTGELNKDAKDRLLYALGNAHERAGEVDLAVATVRQILDKNPDDARALNFIGYTFTERGIHLDEARQMLEKAFALKPEDGYIADSLGWLYYQRGDFEKAVELLTRADELSPAEPVILSHLGDALLKLERRGDAQSAFERAQRALAHNPDADVERALVGKLRELSQRH